MTDTMGKALDRDRIASELPEPVGEVLQRESFPAGKPRHNLEVLEVFVLAMEKPDGICLRCYLRRASHREDGVRVCNFTTELLHVVDDDKSPSPHECKHCVTDDLHLRTVLLIE